MFKHTQLALAVAVLTAGGLSGCDAAPAGAAGPATSASIPMQEDGGIYEVPVSVNGVVTIDCIVDSGASDVNIPADAFRKLLRAGTVRKEDYLGTDEYTLADGSTERGRTFRIRSLKVGNFTVHDVVASIGGDGSSALLGQSFLRRFRSWSLDNTHHALVLLGPALAPPVESGTDVTTAPASRPAGPPAVARASDAPDGTTVAQVRGGGDGHVSRAVPTTPDPTDDRLTAQHSESH